MHVVLFQPLIPQNTGSVGRLCVGTGARLHLVEPLGFDISEKAVRRAGLDYWKHVDLHVHPDLDACLAATGAAPERVFWLSAAASRVYTEPAYQPGDVLVFGRETTGLPRERALGNQGVSVPRFGPVRSFNLATTVGIVLFEALRQTQPHAFPPPPP
ncbi:MAG: tRNA (cytidine(34)-2'-O)-methyltransferase [Deltaproteobacteria bacterium]|nr:tRNA (cytidine(34)-2'-O)-methyltransferase [Deltaproteobacteria bacterium]